MPINPSGVDFKDFKDFKDPKDIKATERHR